MDKHEQAQTIVTNHVLWAMGGGLIPIPLADLSAITAIELDMLSKLAELYEVDFERGSGKNFISAMTGTTLAVFGASLIKSLPGFGTLLGGLTLSVAAGGLDLCDWSTGDQPVRRRQKPVGSRHRHRP